MSDLPEKLFAIFEGPTKVPEDERYYASLGRFIVAYAAGEGAIHELARKLSGLKDEKARALFGGMRIGEVITKTRALLAHSTKSPAVRQDIEACLKQFDVVGLQRDKMVHRTTSFLGDKFSISNESTAKSLLQVEKDLFSIEDLMCLQLDCLTILLRLMPYTNPLLRRISSAVFRGALHGPWQYKRARPAAPKKPSRKSRRLQALQRKSSQA